MISPTKFNSDEGGERNEDYTERTEADEVTSQDNHHDQVQDDDDDDDSIIDESSNSSSSSGNLQPQTTNPAAVVSETVHRQKSILRKPTIGNNTNTINNFPNNNSSRKGETTDSEDEEEDEYDDDDKLDSFLSSSFGNTVSTSPSGGVVPRKSILRRTSTSNASAGSGNSNPNQNRRVSWGLPSSGGGLDDSDFSDSEYDSSDSSNNYFSNCVTPSPSNIAQSASTQNPRQPNNNNMKKTAIDGQNPSNNVVSSSSSSSEDSSLEDSSDDSSYSFVDCNEEEYEQGRNTTIDESFDTIRPSTQQMIVSDQIKNLRESVVSGYGSITNQKLDRTSLSATATFAMEHRIFLRAILSLLAERDQFAIEAASADDPRTIKAGPLKKASQILKGIWKVKYVEIRRGLFSYYGDNAGGGTSPEDSKGDPDGVSEPSNMIQQFFNEEVRQRFQENTKRKSLPLRANLCTCRAVKVQQKLGIPAMNSGFIFELTVEGGPRRLWMANSREERQNWIHAIHEAMIGGSVVRSSAGNSDYYYGNSGGMYGNEYGIPMDSPHKRDLEKFVRVRRNIKNAEHPDEYLYALQDLFGKSLKVPVQWIKEQIEVMEEIGHQQNNRKSFIPGKSNNTNNGTTAFRDGTIQRGVSQLWKDMLRDSVEINGVILKGDEGHGPERILGALTRCIMTFDKMKVEKSSMKKAKKVNESAAVSFARDILLAANRTRSGGDSYYCVDTMCSNPDLVCLCPMSSEAEPLQITVSCRSSTTFNSLNSEENNDAMNKDNDNTATTHMLSKLGSFVSRDKSGWVKMRNKLTKRWKKRFCVLSEAGVFSYYEKEKPRPHGLRGQIDLLHATMGISEVGGTRYIVALVTKDKGLSKERQLCFNSKEEFMIWKPALENAINGGVNQSHGSDDIVYDNVGTLNHDDNRQVGEEKENLLKSEDSEEDDNTSNEDNNSENEQTEKQNPPSTSNSPKRPRSSSITSNTPSGSGRSSRPAVYINVRASTMYKICTTDPDGVDEDDTWVTLRTDFLQNFRLTDRRIIRGEEIVEMKFLQGLRSNKAFQQAFASHTNNGVNASQDEDFIQESSRLPNNGVLVFENNKG